MNKRPLFPDDFIVLEGLTTDRMRLRMLTIHDVVKDFDAVMSSKDRLQTVFRPGSTWPDGLTLEQNLIDLGWHQYEFQNGTSFCYTVVALDEAQILGCVYIYPADHLGHDAQISMWVRQSEAETGLDDHLFETVQAWIARDWPFRNPGYPGRTSDWTDWR
ncbi:MAG: GNAT family N-acetyltransferase [Pseudomonadota bacterium]